MHAYSILVLIRPSISVILILKEIDGDINQFKTFVPLYIWMVCASVIDCSTLPPPFYITPRDHKYGVLLIRLYFRIAYRQ
jgi:hypothetical protein